MSVFANLATHVNVYTPSTALPFFRALVPINPMSATCGCHSWDNQSSELAPGGLEIVLLPIIAKARF